MATQKTPKKETAKKSPAKKPAQARAAKPSAGATAAAVEPQKNAMQRRREVVGAVVSDKMQKTIVVKVDRRIRHRLYKKYVTLSRRFKAHDEGNEAKTGDWVQLVESRPLSREKRWALKKIIRRAGQAPEANV